MNKNHQLLKTDTKGSLIAGIMFIIIIIAVAIGVSMQPKKISFDQEKKKCNELATETTIKRGTNGYCDIYIGNDKTLHYKYVREINIDIKQTEDVYIIWETGKMGRY